MLGLEFSQDPQGSLTPHRSHSTNTTPHCQTQESREGKQEQVQGIYVQRNTQKQARDSYGALDLPGLP